VPIHHVIARATGIIGLVVSGQTQPAAPAATPPAVGDVIINEYAADNDAKENDFFELLVLRDRVDLRGLRVTDNELIKGALNNGEAVFVFGNDPFLAAVPRGTLIAVWTATAGITTDTVVNPAANDWKLVLAPGTGVTLGADGLGGGTNVGFSNNGDSIYVYLPGPNGTSAGTDNVYLDFVSWEKDDDAAAPPGLTDLNLASPADNAYYTGTSAPGNDVPTGWVRYNSGGNAKPSPGDPNPNQKLDALRKQ
jgi:hypothetical protein